MHFFFLPVSLVVLLSKHPSSHLFLLPLHDHMTIMFQATPKQFCLARIFLTRKNEKLHEALRGLVLRVGKVCNINTRFLLPFHFWKQTKKENKKNKYFLVLMCTYLSSIIVYFELWFFCSKIFLCPVCKISCRYKSVIAEVSLADMFIKTHRKWEDLSFMLCIWELLLKKAFMCIRTF